jgi:hypothetical protein
MSLRKIIRTDDLPKKEIDEKVRSSAGMVVITGRPPGQSAVQYIEKYGLPEEVEGLAARIAERRSKLPKFIYLICPKCGWKSKQLFGDRDLEPEWKDYCWSCNRQRYVDGGILREMSAKELKAYEKEQAEKQRCQREKMFKASFFVRNQSRQAQGLPPLTESEFREQRRRPPQIQQGKR